MSDITIDLTKWADMVHPLTETPRTGFKRILIHGDMGSGKTHFIHTCPQDVLLLNVDKGEETLLSVLTPAEQAHFYEIRIPYGVRNSRMLVRDVLTKFKDHTGPFAPDGKYGKTHFGTLAMDSGTAFGEMTLHEIMRTVKVFSKTRGERFYDPLAEKPEYDHWQMFKAYWIEIGNIMKDIDHANVVVTFTSSFREDENVRKTKGLPDVQGSTKSAIGKWFDYVLYFECDDGKFKCHTQPYSGYVAKVRGTMPKVIDSPTFTGLFGGA